MSLRQSVGASRPAQLEDNAAASGLVVDPALFAKAEAIVAAIRIAALGLDRRRRRLVFAERVRRHCASRAARDR